MNLNVMSRKARGCPASAIALAAVLACFVWAPGATAQVQTDPSAISFESTDQSLTVKLTHNGEPVPASAVKGFNIFVGEHDYREMLDMSKADGQVTFTPTDYVEIGSYRMVIYTDHGEAVLTAYTPLSTMPNTIEKQAAAAGVSKERMRELLGITGNAGPGIMTLTMPSVYYLGQTVPLSVPAKEYTNYVWTVNGETVAEGPEAHTVDYTFKKTGPHVFTQVQTKDGEVVLSATAATNVAEEPPIVTSIAAGNPLILAAPAGYGSYTWTLDGGHPKEGDTWRHTFEAPGQHVVQCRADTPVTGDPNGFRVLTYAVTVNPR